MKKMLIAAAIAIFGCAASNAQGWEPKGENIKTRWAAEVSPENARTEYPRPQMVRSRWQCLNGLWDYAVTPKETVSMPEAEGQILVPFCIESSLSGVCRRVGPDQLLWYRTTVSAPESWAGERILLHFDAVDWSAEVFGDGGRITQMTMNSVWSGDGLAKLKVDARGAASYGTLRKNKRNDDGSPLKDESAIFDEYRPGLKRYLHASGAGSFKMTVTGYGVTIDFYGGDSREITESFVLR